MVIRLFFLLLFSVTPLIGEEILVNLNASSSLSPLCLEIENASSHFDQEYQNKVMDVFRFDFNHNGKTRVVTKKEAPYKIVGAFKEKTLAITYPGKVEITLSGVLQEDRRQIHRLSDALYQTLFHEKGIASGKLMYIVRSRQGAEKNPEKWKSTIFESDYDGENARPLIKEEGLCVTPAHVPGQNAGSFLYVTYKTGQSKIYHASLNGSFTKKKATSIRGNQLMPTYCLQNHLLAFVSDATGNPEVFIQNFGQENSQPEKPWQATFAPQGAQGSPTFSPNGKKFAFVSNKDGAPRIYVSDVPPPFASIKDLKPVLITRQTRDNTSPAWSPDGKKIAYSALVKGTRQIWIYDVTTKKETPVTEGGGHKENPTWAPNSSHLFFDLTMNNTSELYLTHIEQKEMVKISKGSGEKRFPAWITFSS